MASAIDNWIYSAPPLIASQDVSQSYPLWSGMVPSIQRLAPPTSPSEVATTPAFSASTNELDRFRVLFLVLGLIIGAAFLGRR